MEDKDKHKEVCELLKIWFYLKTNNLQWPQIILTLEERINILTRQEGV